MRRFVKLKLDLRPSTARPHSTLMTNDLTWRESTR